MPTALADRMEAARIAEGRRRMTHWAPPALIPRPSLADVAEFAAEAVTPYGNYVSARDAVQDFQGGHPVSGSMNALLALPGLGIVGAVGRGAKRAGKTVNALAEGVDAYHGTRAAEFDVFRPGQDGGMYFSNSLADAGGFSTAYPASGANGPSRVMRASVNIRNPLVRDLDGELFEPDIAEAAIAEARSNGYDGVILNNVQNFDGSDPSTTYIAFKPEQISMRKTRAAQPRR